MSRAVALVRLFLLLTRPGLLSLLALFAVVGLVQGGAADRPGLLVAPWLAVVGFVVAAVALNDLCDVALDRINLPGDRSRPLVTGAATRRAVLGVAGVGAVTALASALAVGGAAVGVVAGGLAFAVAYSVRPLRLADRGPVAPLLLPIGYVAVPFVLGRLAAGGGFGPRDAALLGGLSLGFVGRILLKDFRDVAGDALLGRRTALVRHGRAVTCRVSAALWCLGSTALLTVPGLTAVTAVAYAVQLALALVALAALARSRHPHRDDALIAAAALLGRGLVLTLLTHLALQQVPSRLPGWSVQAVLTAGVVLTAAAVVRTAPPAVRGAASPAGRPSGRIDPWIPAASGRPTGTASPGWRPAPSGRRSPTPGPTPPPCSPPPGSATTTRSPSRSSPS